MSLALVWLRRDLRLTDNAALAAACARHTHVLPIFIWAPEEEAPWTPGAASQVWLHHSLAALERALRARGSSLVLRRGPSLDVLLTLARESGACAVYWNRLYEPALVARDARVKAALCAAGLEAESFNGALLAEPWELKTSTGGAYRVFTPFWRALETRLRAARDVGHTPQPAPPHILAPRTTPPSLPLAALELLPRIRWDEALIAHWQPGESGALARLEGFLGGAVGTYRERRDFPTQAATSRLSPHLHFGEISPLTIVARIEAELAGDALRPSSGAEWFLRELAWREFAHHLLYHFPHTAEAPLDERFNSFPWRPREEYAGDLRAWQRGATGIPIVDAGMRELWVTGWMHNRVRMIVASLLTKNLLIPWQAGARWFWDTLMDAGLANNTLGWQWTAGCGADAAPYFRMFNPVLQSQKFDPQGLYLKRWLPELRELEGKALHAPWTAPVPPRAYFPPICDLAATRARALAAFASLPATSSAAAPASMTLAGGRRASR